MAELDTAPTHGELDVETAPSGHLVRAGGEIDIANAGLLVQLVRKALMRGAESICVDLTATTFMDVSGVRALIEIERTAEAYAAPLEIICPGRAARRVIELTHAGGSLPSARPALLH
jgi:anti-anti-sigma factor